MGPKPQTWKVKESQTWKDSTWYIKMCHAQDLGRWTLLKQCPLTLKSPSNKRCDPPPDSSTTLPPNNVVSPAKEDTKPDLQPGGLQPTIPVVPPGGPKFSVFDTEARYCFGLNPVNAQFIFQPVAFPFSTKPAARSTSPGGEQFARPNVGQHGDDEEYPKDVAVAGAVEREEAGERAGERKRLKEKAIRKRLKETRKKLPKTRTRRKRPNDPRRAKPRANMNAKVFHLVSDSFLFRMILGHV